MYTILLADDDLDMLNMLAGLLERDGHRVAKAASVGEVKAYLEDHVPDLFLLDMLLEDGNGLDLCTYIRRNPDTVETPVIFLTGVGETAEDVVRALNAGGDDYIRKPFASRELLARVRAKLRGHTAMVNQTLPLLNLRPDTHQLFVDGREVELTRVEFTLLMHLCSDPNRWWSTRDLLTEVWNYPGNIGDAALVRNHIRNLRRKLEDDPARPSILISRHRRGYMVQARVQIGRTSINALNSVGAR